MKNNPLLRIANELIQIADHLRSLASKTDAVSTAVSANDCLECGTPIDSDHRAVRGCHYRCYRRLSRMVEDGLVTFDELVAAGKLLEAKPGGRKPSLEKINLSKEIKEAARLVAKKAEVAAKPTASQQSRRPGSAGN